MESQTGKDHPESGGLLTRSITRRQAIKAGGIAAVGLAFSKPLIETVMPKPAFANYVVAGQPSIEWAHEVCGDDINDILVFLPDGTPSPIDVGAFLQNVSDDDPATPFDALIEFLGVDSDAAGQFDSVLINGAAPPIVVTFADGLDMECKPITFTIALNGNFDDSAEVKLKFRATANGAAPAASPILTITLK